MATSFGEISSVVSVTSAASSSTSAPESSITSAPSASASGSVSSSSSSRGPQVHTVKAGAGGFKFDPPELKDVAVGDTVTFEFYPPDHSVARAEFKSPCVPYEYTGRNKTGFWSDTQWVDDFDHVRLSLPFHITNPDRAYADTSSSHTGT